MPLSGSETFEQALSILDYEAFRAEQERARAAGRYLGVGACTYLEPTAGAAPFHVTEGATIRIEPLGKVNVYVAGGSAGNSLETTVIQLTADALGVDIGDVNTIQGDTAVTPFGGGTGGSRSGSMTAGAINETARAFASEFGDCSAPSRCPGRRHRVHPESGSRSAAFPMLNCLWPRSQTSRTSMSKGFPPVYRPD